MRCKKPSRALWVDNKMVLRAGLEPARLAAHAPQACVSTNSTTRAIDTVISHLEEGVEKVGLEKVGQVFFCGYDLKITGHRFSKMS